jgi:dolichyl-phosphate beta-glucosyltransferase
LPKDEAVRTGKANNPAIYGRILKVSIIIPALNEREKIQRDLRAAQSFLEAAAIDGEIIVVADGSTDDTISVAESCRTELPRLRVLPLTNQRGKGAAIKRGVEVANGSIIMFADAGLCVPFDDALAGIALLDSRTCELAHGSRSDPKTVLLRVQPLWRRLGSRAFRSLIYLVMGIPRTIGDTQCGFKLYRADVARDLYADLFTAGYMFDIEIILRAVKRGYRITGFPVRWSNDADSRYHPIKGTIQVIRQLAAIRWRLSFERSRAAAPKPTTVTPNE